MLSGSRTFSVLVLAGSVIGVGTLGPLPSAAQVTPGAVRSTLPGPAQAPVRPGAEPKLNRPSRPNIEDTGPKIRINRFELSGNQAISTEELQAQLAPFTDTELSLIGIYDVADALTEYYRDRGFSVANVNVPAQKVSGGVVKFVILEGRIGKVDVEGNEKYSFDFIRERVQELKPGTYLKGDLLRRNVKKLRELPGANATAVVQPGAAFGDSDVIVKVDEDPYDVVIRADNHGRESIGRVRAQADLFLYNPTGIGDQFSLSGLVSEGLGLKYMASGYSIPVGLSGARWELNFSRHFYEVRHSIAGPNLELRGDGFSAQTGLRYPVIRDENQNLDFGAWYSHTKSDSYDGSNVNRDKLNQIIVGLDYDRSYGGGAISRAGLRYATNFNRNTDFQNAADTTDNAQLGKFELNLSHVRPIMDRWQLLGRLNGVMSIGPLMEIERFRLGGPTSVRGFPSSEIAGDAGFQFTLQAQRPFALAKGVPAVFKAFFDTGVVYRMKEPRNLAGDKVKNSLTSLGIGLRVSYAERYSFDLEAARPLNAHRPSDGQNSGRIWASFNALF